MNPFRHAGFRLFAAYLLTALLSAFVAVRFTARGTSVKVPALAGLDVKLAQENASRKGLETEIVEEKWSDVQPAGTVISQTPAADTKTKRGRRVRLTVSRGSKILAMPELSGRALDEARFVLRQAGLRMSGISTVPSAAGKDVVLAQNPTAGLQVPRDRPVTVLVSGGPAAPGFAIPHVTGLPVPEALDALRHAGLRITEVSRITSTVLAAGTVLAQDPPGGWRAVPGDEVKLKAVMASSSAGDMRYVPITITAPDGPARRIRVVIVDEAGRREVVNEIVAGGEVLRLPTRVTGEAVAQIFVAGTLVREEKL